MKKTALLHAGLSAAIARLGHGDTLVIGDAGLPVPPGVPCIDLALTANIPRMADVLRVVLQEMQVESALLADEFAPRNPAVHAEVRALLGKGLPVAAVDGVVNPDVLKRLAVDVVAFSADAAAMRAVRQALAARSGPLVPLLAETIYPAAYAHERAVCVDTTAAGDTFIGALCAALREGAPLVDAIALGQAASALCVTRPGAQPSIPYRGELVGAYAPRKDNSA